MDLQARLGIFRFMAFIFRRSGSRCWSKSFDPDNAANFQRDSDWPEIIWPFRINDHADFALIVAFIRIRRYLKSPEQKAMPPHALLSTKAV